MLMRVWWQELSEEARSAWAVLRSFWQQEVRSLLMTLWVFFALAAPILLVILILWYLDAIGWRSGAGYYTIGDAARLLTPAPAA